MWATPFSLRAINSFNGLEESGRMPVSLTDPAFGRRRRVVFIIFPFPWNFEAWLSRFHQFVIYQISASIVLPDVHDFCVLGP